MNDEKGMRVLTSLVALGIFVVAGLAAFYQSILALPLAIIGLIFVPFILVQNKEKYASSLHFLLFVSHLFVYISQFR